MKNLTTKKITITGLLLIVCLPGFLFVYLQIRQVYIRHVMDDRIEKNIHLEKEAKTNNQGYQEIEIAEGSLVWYEEGREIVVNGVMFDVISIRNENGIAYITGIFDHDETEVLNKVGKLNRQTQKEKDGSVGSKFMAFVFYNESAPAYLLSPFATRLKHNVYWIFQMTSPIREIHCPPPRIVVA